MKGPGRLSKVKFTAVIALAGSVASLGLMSCTGHKPAVEAETSVAIRPQTLPERLFDYELLVTSVRELYAPTEYKQKRFGFKLEELIQTHRAELYSVKEDSETFGVFKRFLAHLQDGHVSLVLDPERQKTYTVPVQLTAIEGQAVVAQLESDVAETHGIEKGDILLKVDGEPVMNLLPKILKYDTLGNDVTNQHFIARVLRRPVYARELVPTRPTVRLKFKKQDGSTYERSLVWTMKRSMFSEGRRLVLPADSRAEATLNFAYSPLAFELAQATLQDMGTERPFFMSSKVQKELELVELRPSEGFLNKYGLKDASKVPALFAGMYRHKERNVLLIRIATYAVSNRMERIAWYKAVLDEFGRFADVLVIDQTHNPGGALNYAIDFVSLFANRPMRGLVHFLHADRRWFNSLSASLGEEGDKESGQRKVWELGARLVEQAYDRGDALTSEPIPLGKSFEDLRAPDDFVWKKPILMLVDELAGSCGDFIPLVMKANARAKLFGQRTMGLGGMVQEVASLPSSQAILNITRSLTTVASSDGSYNMDQMIENNGVAPDIEYKHTIKDFRAGYASYAKAFSDAAVSLLEKGQRRHELNSARNSGRNGARTDERLEAGSEGFSN